MRLFLVGMCDIFLILYLTTLSGEGGSKSAYTEADYVQLQMRSEELIKELQAVKAGESDLSAYLERERTRLKELLLEQRELASELEREQLENRRLAEEKRAEQETNRRKLEEKRVAIENLRRETEKRLDEERQQREDLRRRTSEKIKAQSSELQQARLAAEQAQRKAEEALEAAQAAKQKAAQSEKVAQEAREKARLAQEARDQAIQGEVKARAVARVSKQKAERFRVRAARKERELKVERNEKKQAQVLAETATKELTIAKRPAAQTFENVLRRSMIPIVVKARDPGLFETKDRSSFLGIPVDLGQYQVVFSTVQTLGVDSTGSSLLRDYEILLAGRRVQEIAYSGEVVALILPERRASIVEPVSMTTPLEELTPTLIAVREGLELGFFDRIRDVSETYFIFPRDRLSGSTVLSYEASGLRVTGDYAGYIRAGDQIVDVGGRLIGIATSHNKIRRLGGISGWKLIKSKK